MLFAQDREPDFAGYGRFGDLVKVGCEAILRVSKAGQWRACESQ